jgi:diadenosine tetraphosphate (Ap4A) HIT family hydrolase
MSKKCIVCNRISKILNNKNPYFVAELETGYVVMGDFQYFNGYTLLLCKQHKTELHQLDTNYKSKFLKEMSEVAEAVNIAFRPTKLNYELLGNTHSHMHWHIFPRYDNDLNPNMPIWSVNNSIRNAQKTKPNSKELKKLKNNYSKL